MAHPLQVAIDCDDVDRLAEFWSALLGYRIFDRSGDAGAPADTHMIYDPDGNGAVIKLHRVAEHKSTKNRVHLDVLVAGPRTTLDEAKPLVDAEVRRATQLGATVVATFDKDTDYFVVLIDPEGTEFCIG